MSAAQVDHEPGGEHLRRGQGQEWSQCGFGDLTADIEALADDALTERFRVLELEQRRLAAEMAAVVAEGQRRNVHAIDGHHSLAGWLRANANWSGGQVSRARKVARLVADLPMVGTDLLAGRLGVAQVEELARVRANPRCGDQLGGSIELLLEQAMRLSFNDFRLCLRRWEMLADLDGAHRDRAESVEARRAAVLPVGDGVAVSASGGSKAIASELAAVFDAFVEAEFRADVTKRTELHGPDASASLLPRTDPQRRFDALRAIFRTAGTAGVGAGGILPVTVNMVVDQWTMETALASHGLGDDPIDLAEPDPAVRRCETSTGVELLPDDIVAALLHGHIRRVVIDSAGVIVDAGRRRRLFTGTARELAKLFVHHCDHLGCTVPATYAEVDHIAEWDRHEGNTDAENAAIACGSHNRTKHRLRLEAFRDNDGHLHIRRPDGTWMLPVGREPPRDAELLTRTQMAELARQRLRAAVDEIRGEQSAG